MASIDDKIISASFENSKFESNAAQTMSTLAKLQQSMQLKDAGKGLDNIENKASRFHLGGMASAIDSIKSKFSALSVVGITALATLASKAVDAGLRTIKAFTIDPITAGFHNYETQINAVQTILANTGLSGKKGLAQVTSALDELNTYANKTVYNFSEMAKNIGTFTAAGVDLKTATASIKGIANLAALSGSNSQQASTAMYQLSQAISAGKVGLQDWNSVVNAGMGGAVFQRALATTAEKMGTLKDGAVKLVGPMKRVSINGKSFREALTAKPGEKSFLTGDVLTTTLKEFTGDMTDAELATIGFSKAQIKSIQTQAKTAVGAATNIKTLSQLMDALKEEVGSAYANIFKTIFGDINGATSLFSGLHTVAENALTGPINNFNDTLKDWSKLGGRAALFDGIKNSFAALGSVIAPIKGAFRDIFPATTGRQLADLSKRFRDFTANLKIGPEAADRLKRAFSGVFAIVDIGKQVLTGFLHVIGNLFSSIGQGSGGFLELAAKVGDFFVSVDKALKSGKGLGEFFDGLSSVLQVPIQLFGALAATIAGLFGGFKKSDADNIDRALGGVSGKLSPLGAILKAVDSAWQSFTETIGNAADKLGISVQSITGLFSGLGKSLANGLANTNWSAVFAAIQTGLLGGIFLLVKRFFSKGLDVNIGNGLLGNISESFEALTGSLTAMQQSIKANTLLKIAAAIGLLTASVVALSLINSANLQKALTAMAVGFGQLLGAMKILTIIGSTTGFIKVPIIASSLILLAAAVDVMVIAVAGLSRLDWNELARGLTGVGALLAGISAASAPLSANSAGLIRAGIGVTAIAVALNILALAVKQFGNMDWEVLGKGLAGVAGALVAVGAAANLFPTGMVAIGAGLVLVAVGLNAMALAVKQFGDMDWQTIGKGLAAVAGSLLIIAGAMRLMPPGMAVQAAGLLLVGAALNVIAVSLKLMGSSSIGGIAKSLGTLAGALAILAVGLQAMTGTLGGAAALAVAAASLTLLVPALKVLGGMSWDEIAHGLVALAGAFTVLGVAGLLLEPVAPAILALGAALLLVGAGFALTGAGLTLISTAISALAVAGPAGIKLLISALTQFAQAIPIFVTSFVTGLLTMVQKIAEVAPQFVAAIGKIVVNLAQAVVQAAPQLAVAMSALITAALSVVQAAAPQIVATGFVIINSLLNGIKNNIGRVTSQAGDIIVRFLNALSAKLPQIVTAGTNLLVTLMRGITSGLPKLVKGGADVITNFLRGISGNISRIAAQAVQVVSHFVSGVASQLGGLVASGGRIIASIISGVVSGAGRIVASAVATAGKFIQGLAKAFLKLTDEGAKAVITLMNGIADAINKYEPQAIEAGARIGAALITGVIRGITANVGKAASAIGGAIGSLVSKAKHAAGIHSPSTVFAEIGDYMMQGLEKGISDNATATAAGAKKAFDIVTKVKQILGIGSTNYSKVMADVGDSLGNGFRNGLLTSMNNDDVDTAFSNFNQKLNDQMQALVSAIDTQKEKLKSLKEAHKQDKDAIDKTTEAMNKNEQALTFLFNAHGTLGKALDAQKTTLKGYANDMADLTTQIDDATRALQDAQKARDDAVNSITGKFNGLPDIVATDKDGNPIDPATQLTTYMSGLSNQAQAVADYGKTLEQLRKLGLDDKTYQKLLDDGTADQAFANQILAGGRNAVQALNALDANLDRVSYSLGTQAATNLYQAGVNSAQALVDGLNSKKSALAKKMEELAETMIKALKKKLHIHSPSRVFLELGAFTMKGLVNGLAGASKLVENAAARVGDTALAAMRKSLGQIPDALNAEIDANPTITPVLDLSQLKKDASQMSDLSNVIPISAAASYGQAAGISQSQPGAKSSGDGSVDGDDSRVTFIQNNTSPEKLSEVEIYRQTKNQLSMAKDALAKK